MKGAEGTLRDLFRLGIAPDQRDSDSLLHVAQQWCDVGLREHKERLEA